jgi:GxxExxY protein
MIHHKGTKDTKEAREKADVLSNDIIGAAIEVRRLLGPGLLESAYEECLARELQLRRVAFERQIRLPIEYKGERLDCGYRLDFIVDGLVIVELKAVDRLEPVHKAQLLTYLRLTNIWLGLLINFNVPVLKNGIERFVN